MPRKNAKPKVDLVEIQKQLAALTAIVAEAIGNTDPPPPPPKKRGRPRKNAVATAADDGVAPAKVGRRKIERDGKILFECSTSPVNDREHTNNFKDDGKIAANESVKLKPHLGVTPSERGQRSVAKKVKVVCGDGATVGCGKTFEVSSNLPRTEIYRCDRCCRKRG